MRLGSNTDRRLLVCFQRRRHRKPGHFSVTLPGGIESFRIQRPSVIGSLGVSSFVIGHPPPLRLTSNAPPLNFAPVILTRTQIEYER